MLDLRIPADIWRWVPDDGSQAVIAIVDGDRVLNPTPSGTRQRADEISPIPPAELVAATTATCDTCQGEGFVGPGPWCLRQPCPNPRCHGGRLTIDINVECLHCGGFAFVQPHTTKCQHCNYHGTLSVSVLADVVPITRDMIPAGRDGLVVMLPPMTSRVSRLHRGDRYSDLAPAHVAALEAVHGPRDTWPGRYAIVATPVPSPQLSKGA